MSVPRAGRLPGPSRGLGRGSRHSSPVPSVGNHAQRSVSPNPAAHGARGNPFQTAAPRGRGATAKNGREAVSPATRGSIIPRGATRGRTMPKSKNVALADVGDQKWRAVENAAGAEWKEKIEALWHSLKRSREDERKNAIKDGLMADPNKPTSLAGAITPVGTCQDMCPEFERVERIHQMMVDGAEKTTLVNGERVPCEDFMVKRFRRSAAGYDEQLPSDIRPPAVLQKTLNYLIDDVVGGPETLASVHKFVWDRTRGIRNDFSIQQVTKIEDLKIAINCFEQIARFHLLSLHQLSHPDRDNGEFDHFQEREQLNNTLLSLMYYYDDSRGKVQSPNEAEFRAYCIIFEIQDTRPDLESRAQLWPKHLLRQPRVQTALKLYAAASNTSDELGPLIPRKTTSIAQANYARFWTALKSPAVPYLMSCCAEIYFNQIRGIALETIWKAYNRPKQAKLDDLILSDVMDALGFDDEDQTETFCQEHGFATAEREDGNTFLDLSSVSSTNMWLSDSNPHRKQLFNKHIVEAKRMRRSFPAIVQGLSVSQARLQGLVDESADDEMIDSRDVASEGFDDAKDTPFEREPREVRASPNPFAGLGATSDSKPQASSLFGQPSALHPNPFTGTSKISNPFAKIEASSIISEGQKSSASEPESAISNNVKSPFLSAAKSSSGDFNPITPSETSKTFTNPFAKTDEIKSSPRPLPPISLEAILPSNASSAGFLPSNDLGSSFKLPSQLEGVSVPPAPSFGSSKSIFDSPAQPTGQLPQTFTPFFDWQKQPPKPLAPEPKVVAPAQTHDTTEKIKPSSSDSSLLFALDSPKLNQPSFLAKPSTPKTSSPLAQPPLTISSLARESASSGRPLSNSVSKISSTAFLQPAQAKTIGAPTAFGAPSLDGISTSHMPPTQTPTSSATLPISQALPSVTVHPIPGPLPSQLPTAAFVPSTSTQETGVQSSPAPGYSGPTSKELLNQFTELYFSEEGGLLQQFLTNEVGEVVRSCVKQVRKEHEAQEIREARRFLLSRKYSRKWREITWMQTLKRKSKARRKEFARSMRDLALNSRSPSHAVSPSPSESCEPLSSIINLPNASRMMPPPPLKPRVKNGYRRSLPADVERLSSKVKPQAQDNIPFEKEKRKPVLRTHKRAQTAGSLGPGSKRILKTTRYRGLTTSIVDDPLFDHEQLMKTASRLVHGRTDTTRTDYFKLKSLGIDPNTPVIPETRKRQSDIDIHDEARKLRHSPTKANRSPLTFSALSASSTLSPAVATRARVPVTTNLASTIIDTDRDDDDALFAEIRKVKAAMSESESWFREVREQSERSSVERVNETEKQRQLREWKPSINRTEARWKRNGLPSFLRAAWTPRTESRSQTREQEAQHALPKEDVQSTDQEEDFQEDEEDEDQGNSEVSPLEDDYVEDDEVVDNQEYEEGDEDSDQESQLAWRPYGAYGIRQNNEKSVFASQGASADDAIEL